MKARFLLALPVIVALVAVAPLPRTLAPTEDELSRADIQVGLAAVSGRVSRAELEAALALLDPRHQLDPFISIGERSLGFYAGAGHRDLVIEVMLRAATDAAGAPTPPYRPPLQTLVVDPGHWGGAWSQLEKRHITVAGGPPVREGDITLSTALRIRAKVPEARLTRTHLASGTFPEHVRDAYDEARERRIALGEGHRLLLPWPTLVDVVRLAPPRRELMTHPFDLYTHYDLRARTMETTDGEAFVSIHYNVASPGQTNGIMAFVHGDYLDGELATMSQRYWAVRRALDGTLPTAIAYATALARAMQRHLRLPALAPDPVDDKPNRIVIDGRAGVFARNLAVLRRAHGVAILLEGPCMNAVEDYRGFASERLSVDGVTIPVRAEAYADAVAETTREFFAQPR